MIKTVLLELGDIFDSSWNRPITEHSATELLLIIVKNPVRIPSLLCHEAAKLQTSTALVRKCYHQIFQGECHR